MIFYGKKSLGAISRRNSGSDSASPTSGVEVPRSETIFMSSFEGILLWLLLTYTSPGTLYEASFRILELATTAFSRKSSSKLDGGISRRKFRGGSRFGGIPSPRLCWTTEPSYCCRIHIFRYLKLCITHYYDLWKFRWKIFRFEHGRNQNMLEETSK